MIHKFKLGGYNILLDVNSGGVHIVDNLTYDLLDNVQPPFEEKCPQDVLTKLSKVYKVEDIKECYDEIVSLYEQGVLYSSDDYEQYSLKAISSPVKAMCLLIAQDCNMRCKYCFAETGEYGLGKRMLMSLETAKKAIDFLVEKSANRKNLEVDFFGGEPLLNFDVVKKTVEYARSLEKKFDKNFRFTITTNGLLLDDDKIDFINKEMYNVVLSIDGRKEVNDRMRPLAGGQGSYDKITKKYADLVSKRGDKDYYVRGTYTKYNLDFSNDVMHLRDLGFEQISVEPVVADKSTPYALSATDLPQIFEEYEKLADKILKYKKEKGFINFFHFMLDLDQGPCAIKRLRGCGSGNEYVAVSPEGDIYPCHQFVGIEEYKMGNLDEHTFNYDIKNEFAAAHVYTKSDCKKCWAKFYCSGGCNANNYIYCGDIHKPHKLSCEIQKKRLECAIMLKAIEFESKHQNDEENS